MNNFLRHLSLLLSLAILGMVFAIQVIHGSHAFITTHDNLDSSVVYFKLVKDNCQLLADCKMPILDGISRNYFGSEFQLVTLLFFFLEPITAYFVLLFLKLVVGFFSMRLLLGSDLVGLKNRSIADFASLAFAVLPSFPIAWLSQAAIPLAIFLLYRFVSASMPRDRWLWGLAVFLYPIISSFFTQGVFILGIALVIAFMLAIKRLAFAARLLTAMTILSIGYLVAEFRMFYQMLFSGVQSMRSNMTAGVGDPSIFANFKVYLLQDGSAWHRTYHAESLQYPIVFFVVVAWLLFNVGRQLVAKAGSSRRSAKGSGLTQNARALLVVSALIVFNCLLGALYLSGVMQDFLSALLPLLSGFNFGRFVLLNGALWCIAFALALDGLSNKTVTIAYTLALAQVGFILFSPAVYNDFRKNFYYQQSQAESLTYDQFYSAGLFERIKLDIGYNNQPSVAVGFHPAVLQFNNIRTLDGYLSIGSLDYKKAFREVIAPELALNERARKYYDNWGGRMYVFSSEADYTRLSQSEDCKIDSLNISTEAFKKLGGVYIFSLCPIMNHATLRLELRGDYRAAESRYHVYVYRAE